MLRFLPKILWIALCLGQSAWADDSTAEMEENFWNSGSISDLRQETDLWARIRNGFALEPPENQALVRHYESWYESHPNSIRELAERSKRYLYFIVDEAEKLGIPLEIALVPMIESGFNPQVYSKYHAAGLWQILPQTGKNFGIRSEKGYDGRRDVIASTDAALKYFLYLHRMFKDWELALAAYNAGEGTVTRALHQNRAKGLSGNYANLHLLPETRHFYARITALKNIIASPEKFGMELEPIPNRPYFAQVLTNRSLDVKLAAKIAEMPVEEFVALNPAGKSKNLLLPVHKAGIFSSRLDSMDALSAEEPEAETSAPTPLPESKPQNRVSGRKAKRVLSAKKHAAAKKKPGRVRHSH